MNYAVTSLLMATFHHANHSRSLSKIIQLKKTTSVLEMTATIQIKERQQNWPPTQLYERLQNAPVPLNLAAVKF